MNNDTTLSIHIKTTWASQGADDAQDDMTQLERRVGNLGKVASGALVGAGAATFAFAKESLKAFTSFEKGMKEVFTLLPGLSDSAMSDMTKDVRELMTQTGRASSEVLPALYQAISAGVPPDTVFSFLETANQAALGGVTDLETAVDGLTSVVNAYGSDVISTSQVSDLMFTAVKGGKTTFEALSQSMFNVIPIASSLGVEFQEVMAATAAMTSQGVPTSVVMTQLRALMQELSVAGKDVSDMFLAMSGQTFREFIASGGTMQEALIMIKSGAEASGQQMSDLFGSVEAASAALALTGAGAEKFSSELDAAADSMGATEEAAETMSGSFEQSFNKAITSVENLKVLIGERLAPAVLPALELITDAIEGVVEALENDDTKINKFFHNLKLGSQGAFGAMQNDTQALIDRRIEEVDTLEQQLQLIRDISSVSGELRYLDINQFGLGSRDFEENAFKELSKDIAQNAEDVDHFIRVVRDLHEMEGIDLFGDYSTIRSRRMLAEEYYAAIREGNLVEQEAFDQAWVARMQSVEAGEAATASAEDLAEAQEEVAASAELEAKALKEVATRLGELFIQSLDITNQTTSLDTYLFEAGQAAGLAAEHLRFLAVATGDYSREEADAALVIAEAKQRAEEYAQQIAEGTMTRLRAIQLLEEEFGERLAVVDALQQQAEAERVAKEEAENAIPVSERAAEALANYREQMALLNAELGTSFNKHLESEEVIGNVATLLYQEAEAAGAGIAPLALLAQETGNFTDAQIKAALAATAMEAKAKELGEAIAGGMNVDEAIQELSEFQEALNGEYAITVDDTSVQEAVQTTERLLGVKPEPISLDVETSGLDEMERRTQEVFGELGDEEIAFSVSASELDELSSSLGDIDSTTSTLFGETRSFLIDQESLITASESVGDLDESLSATFSDDSYTLLTDDSAVIASQEVVSTLGHELIGVTTPNYQAKVEVPTGRAFSALSSIEGAILDITGKTYSIKFKAEFDSSGLPSGDGSTGAGDDGTVGDEADAEGLPT